MTTRDRGLIAALSVALVVLSIAALAPSAAPIGSEGGQPSTLPGQRPYVEGVLGHATNASPFGARSTADRALVALLFRGLVRLGPGNTIVPDLATSWDVDASGADWTFHLRAGLTWQDGTPLTADDVVFTVTALSDPTYTGPGAASWREVTATAPDPLTVRLQLATPLGGFLVAATQPIAPAHLLAGVAPADLPNDPFGQHPVGSGPFQLTLFDASKAVLDAAAVAAPVGADGGPNASAPGPTDSLRTPPPTTPGSPVPYLSGIEFRYFDDVASLRAAWDGGELDAASGLAPADTRTLGTTPGARILSYPSSTLLAVDLNLRGLTSAFRDVHVRKALLQAIDRDAIVADVLDGLGSRADSLVPPTSPLFDAQVVTTVAFSMTMAGATLTAAGWKHTAAGWLAKGAKQPLAIQVLSPEASANPVAYDVAAAVVAGWRTFGLDATQVVLPPEESLGDGLARGGYAAAVVPLAIGLDPDLYPLLASSQTRTGGANISGLQDPALDRLLAAARAPNTDAGRLAAYAKLEQSLDASMYILPIAFRDDDVVLRDTVVGPTARPIGTSGDRFWDVLTWRLADGR